MFCVCRTILQISYQSQVARSGDIASLSKRNRCMKLQKGTRVKLTQEKNLFYLPCSVLEFKMSSNSVKLDSARKWHRRLGHLNQADVVRNAPVASGESNDEKKNHKALKDAYENEVADIKEKRKNVWCHLAVTLDATTLMLMRHDRVEDDGIADGAKAWKLLHERFQSVETPTVVILVAKLARLQLEDAEDLDSFFIRGQELLTRLQEAGEAVSETLFNALVLNGLPMRYESFVIQESFNPATNFTELRKTLQNFHESTAQGTKWFSGTGSEA